MNDELTHVLAKLKDADAVILGSPIYLGNSTGERDLSWSALYFHI
jgi:multimeric flavodoxin WrbA